MNLLPLRQLAVRNDGTAVIELALIAPIIATMLIGVIDFTLAFNRKLVLEQAVQRSIERVMQTTTDDTVENNIKAEVAAGAGITTDKVTVTYTLTCNGASKSWDTDCSAGETAVRYLNVKATDTYTPMLPLANIGIGKSTLTLVVESGLRTV